MELNRLPMTPLQRSLSDAYGQMQATPFERGFTSSDLATQAASLETSAMEAATTGDLATRDALLGQAKGLRQRAIGWAPRVDSMADIENPIDALSFAAQGMGSAARSTAPSIMGGLAGAATGVGLPAALAARGIIGGGAAALNAARAMPATLSAVQRFAPMVGAMVPGYQAEMEEAVGGAVNDQQIMDTRTPDEILAAARGKGLINMIPEAIGPAMMVSKVAGTGLRKAVTSPKQGVGTALKGVATGFGTEAATEGVQSLVGQATQAGLRNEQFNPDWQQVAADAVIGGLFGGGMGVVGGVADAAYGATRGTVDGAGDAASAIGKGAQNILGRIGGAAEQNPTIQRGMDTAKQYGQAAVDAAGRFVDGARGTFQEGMDDLRQHVDDSMQAYKAGAGSEIATTDAANAIRKGVGTIVDSIVSGVAEVTGKKKEEAQADVDNLTANPFTGGHADSGFDDPQAVAQHYSEYVQKNGKTAAIVAQRILDNTSLAAHVPDKARTMLKQALAKDESGVPFIKNGTVAAERMQGQIGMLIKVLQSRESLKRSVDDIYNSFVEAQVATNTTVPGKFSRQATMQPDAVANVRQYLEDLGLDKQVVNKLSTLAGKGNKSMFDMAVDRDLLGQNLLGDIHDKESAKFASEQAKMIKALVSEQAVADTPKANRSERRKAKQEAHAIKSANEVDRNLSALPHLIDEVVGQHLEEAAKNAEGFLGDALNTPDVRNMMTNALTQLVIGIIDDKVTPQQIAKMISAANEHMGEAGAAMLDRIASIAEWHATRAENPKIAQRAAALRDSLDGNGRGAPIHALSKVLGGKPSKETFSNTHKIMGQLIGAYIDTYQGDGPTYELRNDLTAAKARKKQAEKQGDEVAAAKYDKQIFDLENQLDGVDLHEHFRNEVKRITGKDVANKVVPIIKKRLQEIHTSLDQPITMRRKGDTDRAGQYVPSKMKSSSNPNFGEADENDNEVRQAISENAAVGYEEAAEMADGVANEGGTQGEVDNNFQHFGGAYGEPVRGKELGQLIRDVVDKHGLARTEVMSVRDWALEEAERTNRSLKSLLSEAAAKLYKADQARLERLKAEHEHLTALAVDKYVRSGKKRALTGGRLEGSGREESEAEVAKRKGVEAAINSTEERIANYETVKGNGEEFFSADSYNANAFKFVTISPAHGAVGTGEVNEKTLDKYTLTSVPKSNDGFTAPGVVKRSVMYLKNENGSTRMLDFSLMLYHQISGSERAERGADVTGAGEKNIESGLVNKVRVAFAQTIASMMMSDALSKDDTFFSVYGEQAYRSDKEFEFNPNMVIYRDPVNHNFLTYGQVFGRKGEDAISSTKVTPTNHKFSDAALESILPSEGVDVWSLDKRSKEHVVPKDWVSTNKVMANGDQRAHFSPRALLKEMMNRYGMRADEILTDSSDGISKTLAAKLIVEGLSVLKAHGWELTTDIGSPTVSSLLLWRTDYGRTVDEMTLGDLKNDILTRLAKGTDADTYGNGKALSTDYRSDKVGRMTERLVEATRELSAAREELARSAGKSSSVIADKKRKVSVKESAVSVLQNNLAIEQKLIYERKAGASEIERLDRRDREMPDHGGVVDIADGVNAERRRDATLFDRSAAMTGDFSGQGHLPPKMVHDATSDSGVRAVNGPATQGMESADGSRRVVDHKQNTDQRAAFKKAKNIENTAGFENAPTHDTRPVGAGTKVEGGRPEGPSIRDKGKVKKDDKPSFTMRSEDVRTTDSNALRRAKAAEAKQALDNEGRRLEGSTKEGARYSTNAVREGAERARERAAEQVAAKTATPKVEAAKIEESKPETPKLGEMMQALVKDTLKLDTAAQRERISAIYNTQGPKVGKPLRDAVAAANPDLMDGSSVLFHSAGKFSLENADDGGGKGKFSRQTVSTARVPMSARGVMHASKDIDKKTVSQLLDMVLSTENDPETIAMARALKLAVAASLNGEVKVGLLNTGIELWKKGLVLESISGALDPEFFISENVKEFQRLIDNDIIPEGFVRAVYSTNEHALYFLSSTAHSSGTILHEITHLVTSRYMIDKFGVGNLAIDMRDVVNGDVSLPKHLENDALFVTLSILRSKVSNKVKREFRAAQKREVNFGNHDMLSMYGTTNLLEFVSEFFGNKDFREQLNNIPVSEKSLKVIDELYDGARPKNLLQAVVAAITKILNTLIRKKNSPLHLTSKAVSDLLVNSVAYERKKNSETRSVGKFSLENAGNAEGVDGRAQDDHERRLGDAVDLLFDKTLPKGVSGQHVSAKDRRDVKNATKALNRVNPGAFSIRGTTAHENWHAVKEMLLAMGPEGQAIVDTIERAAHRPESLGWIAQQLAARGTGNEAALKQLADPEEASAFLFQFFVENEGKMPVPLGARGVLSRVTKFLKNLVGIRDDIIKAGDFFNYFNSGEFLKNHANPQAVLEGMLKNKAEKAAYHLNKAFAPIRELASAAFGHAIDRIREMKIPEYNDAIDRYTKGWDGYAGYGEEQRARFMEYSNEYAEIVEGHDLDHLPEAQQKQLEKLIQRFEKYRKDAGFGSGFNTDRKKIPPSLDTEKISANLNGFKHDLLTYGGVKINEGDAEAIVNQIMVDGYWRDRHSLTGSSKADLFFDHPEIMNKWKSADKNQHAFTYFKEGTRAAELARINNPPAESNLPPLSALLEAGDAKATPHQRKMMKALMATYEGRSSYEMNPTLRKLFGASISFMNMSLLPFAVFSQMLEPLQLAFRKNSLDGTLRTAWRGLTDLPRTFEAVDSRMAKDKWEKISGKLGLIPVHAAVGMMAELMSDIPLTGKLQKANQIFFRYNGMEQWTRSMHIAATQNAFEFIKHHDKHPTELGRRLLGELGLKPGQVRYAADGEIDFDEPAMRRAILQYVNESMAHPDPGTNTMWMNDPHFALLAHLKRFTFGFSYYIHGRALNEIKNDNWKALLPLAYAIPWMIAVDCVKDFIKPGDEAYKNNWDVSDYVIHGADRAGLYGRYGIGADIGKNIGFGGSGVESLAPTAEAVSKVMRGVADGNTLDAVGSILPGHQFVQ